MNLRKLSEMQTQLDTDISEHHPVQNDENRLRKKILALLVELGECANEWRGFKFWSNNQKPNDFERENCPTCLEKGYYRGNPPQDEKKGVHSLANDWYWCDECSGFLVVDKNPLLEEYVDCLHFILSIGNDLYFDWNFDWDILESDEDDITKQFENTFEAVLDLSKTIDTYEVMVLFEEFYILGLLLGFTWEDIERAYCKKNQVNYERQKTGY